MKFYQRFFRLIAISFLCLAMTHCPAITGGDGDNKNNNTLALAALAMMGSSSATVTTLSLSESGVSDSTKILNQPEDLAVGSDGNIYVADSKNHRIVKITNETTVTEIVPSTGNGTSVTVINNPEGITQGPTGILYVANTGASSLNGGAYDGHNILKIDINNSNALTLLSGANRPANRETIDGTVGTNRYFKPEGIRYANNKLVVGENGGFNVREVNISTGEVTTLAGEKVIGGASPTPGTPIATDGPALSARFNGPKGVVADSKGNVYIADGNNHCIRKFDPVGDTVSTFAGSRAGSTDASAPGFVDGVGTSAKFNGPYMITIDSNDNIYVADGKNFAIRKITSAGVVSTIAGGTQGRTDGVGSAAKFYNPIGIYFYNNTLYVTDKAKAKLALNPDPNDYSTIRKITGF